MITFEAMELNTIWIYENKILLFIFFNNNTIFQYNLNRSGFQEQKAQF